MIDADIITHLAPATRNILGVDVALFREREAIDALGLMLARHIFTPTSFLNAHTANIATTRPDFTEALKSFIVLPDGIGVDIGSKLLYGAPFPANLNGTDFVPALLIATRKPLKIGILGTTEKNARLATEAFSRLAPQHQFHFISDGFFNQQAEGRILADLRRLQPDILLVALGVPRQEMWIHSKLTKDHCTMPIAVGALLDFISGSMPRAPLWLRKMRLEWLFRLSLEPRRLFARYVLGNPIFLFRILRQKLNERA